jgi:F420-non-reducing hydrogenase small subunit
MSAERTVSAATAWLQTCSGCHMALLDLHEGLLDLLAAVDLRYSPIMDVKEVPPVDVALVEGGIGNEEEEARARELREKARILIAFGSCACFGGLPGLRNLYDVDEVVRRAFSETVTDGCVVERHSEAVPALFPRVRPLTEVIPVDYAVPGCPPRPELLAAAVTAALHGEEFVMSSKNLCSECPREQKEMHRPQREFLTAGVYAPFELAEIDSVKCFLEQGVLCLGPATRAGCEAQCLNVNVPCRGCYGPPPAALEQGGKMVDSLASILPAGALMFAEDTVGTGYRFTLPVSIIPAALEGGDG